MSRGDAGKMWNNWLPRIRGGIAVIALGLAIASLLGKPSLRFLPAIFICGALFFLFFAFGAGKRRAERMYFFFITVLCAGAAYLSAVCLW